MSAPRTSGATRAYEHRVWQEFRPLYAAGDAAARRPYHSNATTRVGETFPLLYQLSYSNQVGSEAGFEPAAFGLHVVTPAFVAKNCDDKIDETY